MAQVYAICFPNGKLYVGWTSKTVEQRFRRHVWSTRKGSTNIVHNALRKYGPDSVRLVTLRSGVTNGEAKELEKWYIEAFATMDRANGYNMTAGGDGAAGLVQSVEARRKKSDALRGRLFSPEHRAKISEALRGKPETSRRTSEAQRGKPKTGKALAAAKASIIKARATLLGKPKPWVAEALRRKWQDPAYRAMMKKAQTRERATRGKEAA